MDKLRFFLSKGKNINKLYKIIILISLVYIFFLIIKMEIIKFRIIKNTKVCICTIVKNENRYIKEFVEHYKKYGVDKILLYDNNNVDGERLENAIGEYIKNGLVETFDYRGKISQQYKWPC